MRRVFLTLFFAQLVFAVLLVGGNVFALDTDNSRGEKFSQRVGDRRENRQEKREDIKERVATKQAQLRREHIQRLKEVFDKILARYLTAIERLDKIVGKLERRIEKLNARGVDTSAATAHLAACRAKKAAAVEAIGNARAQLGAIDPESSTVKETVKVATDAMQQAKRAIHDYHKCLGEVTRGLKGKGLKEGTESAQ